MEAMRQSWSDDRLGNLEARMDERFDAVDRRLGEVDRRLDRLETGVARGFAEMNKRFDSLMIAMFITLGGLTAALAAAVVTALAN